MNMLLEFLQYFCNSRTSGQGDQLARRCTKGGLALQTWRVVGYEDYNRTWLFFVTASQSSTRRTFSVSGTARRISGLLAPSSSSRPLLVPRPPSLRRPPPTCVPRADVEVFEAEALVEVAAA